MSSGIYAALSASSAKMKSMEVITNNLANANTHGYKRDRLEFDALFRAATQNQAGNGLNFVGIRGSSTDFSQGETEPSGNPLDLAIEGEGFFKLQGPDGFYFSRKGNFSRSAAGELVNGAGWQVMDAQNQPIVIADPQQVTIDESGGISSPAGAAGTIPLFTVDDLSALRKAGNGSFALSAGQTERPVAQPRMLQRRLEISNVQPLQEMADMIDNLRLFESCQRVLKTYGELANKANALGSLG